MATFVLVHGSSHGGWCWKKVIPLLRKGNHEVYTPTLTGLGERSHLISKTFNVPGGPLPLELISGGYANQTTVYGPDFSSGAYHLEAPFLKHNANYTIQVEIAATNGKQPQNKIMDGFSLRTIT